MKAFEGLVDPGHDWQLLYQRKRGKMVPLCFVFPIGPTLPSRTLNDAVVLSAFGVHYYSDHIPVMYAEVG